MFYLRKLKGIEVRLGGLPMEAGDVVDGMPRLDCLLIGRRSLKLLFGAISALAKD